jgi:hypothetical protein
MKALGIAVGGVVVTGWLAGAVLAEDAAAGSKVPLQIPLPKALFVGTPVPISGLPNLEKPLGRPRDPLMVPEGTTLLSKGKPVTSSDSFPIIGELDLVTDGDKEGTDGSYVELAPQTQWVQIDLGAEAEVQAVVVWHYHAQARVYHDVIVQLSDDPDFIAGVKTLYNNDHDNSSGLGVGADAAYTETAEGRLIKANGEKGRYVRLYSRGNTSNDMNHYIEVEVYGKLAP